MICNFSFPGFTRELYIVNRLTANMLVGVNAIGSEGFVIDLLNKVTILKHCESAKISIIVIFCMVHVSLNLT